MRVPLVDEERLVVQQGSLYALESVFPKWGVNLDKPGYGFDLAHTSRWPRFLSLVVYTRIYLYDIY